MSKKKKGKETKPKTNKKADLSKESQDNIDAQTDLSQENNSAEAEPRTEDSLQENIEVKETVAESAPTTESVSANVTSAQTNVKPIKVVSKRKMGHEERTNLWGYVFVAPFIITFLVFNLWPTINTLMLGFTNETALSAGGFVGLAQFKKLILEDKYFWGALANTFIIWGFNFVPQLGIALILAIYLSDIRLNLAGKGLFRAIVYLPNLLTAASVAMLFRYLFGFGGHINAPANQFLRALGYYDTGVFDANGVEILSDAINFFRSIPFSRGLVSFIQWWMWYGHTLILLMAGITSIPISLFESAVVDGANSRQTSWFITLPLLRPMMLYLLVTSMIGGMQMFDIPFLLTDMAGSPQNSIRTTVMYQYNTAFTGRNDYGYGSAVSMGIFIVTIVLAMLIFFFMQDRSELKKKKGGAK